jgi:hypothetical protein
MVVYWQSDEWHVCVYSYICLHAWVSQCQWQRMIMLLMVHTTVKSCSHASSRQTYRVTHRFEASKAVSSWKPQHCWQKRRGSPSSNTYKTCCCG